MSPVAKKERRKREKSMEGEEKNFLKIGKITAHLHIDRNNPAERESSQGKK